jgi:hypothetical protein
MTSKGIPESQPDVESFLNLSFCDYEDQSQKLCLGILSPNRPAVADLEWPTNKVFFHREKLFSPGQ